MIETIMYLYCRLFHHSISRPVHSSYKCWRCLREFQVNWTQPAKPGMGVTE